MFSRDFLYLAVSALQVILAALITPVLTRSVSVSEFGQLALAMTVAQLLGPIFSFGLPFAAQKVFAGEDGDHRSRGVLAISAALAAAASLVVLLAAPAWGPAVGLDEVLYASLAVAWSACFALTLTSLAILRSRERLPMVIFVASLQSLGAQSTGVLLLYLWAHTVTSYLCGLVLGQGIAAFAGLLAVRPDWSALAAMRRYRRAFHFGLPMVPQQLSGIILYTGDRVVVAHLLGSAAVGRYAVAYNVGNLGCVLLVFVNQAWMPRIYAVADRVARSRLLASSRDRLNLLLIPVVCGLAAGAPVVLRLWAPKSFHPAELTPIVAIIAICAFPYGQFLSNLRALMSEGRTGRVAVTTLVAAAVNIGLNLVMVPFLGITGSAIATALCFALLAWLTRQPARSGLQVPGASFLLRILIGGAVAVTLAIGAMPTSSVWLAVRLVLGAGAVLAFALLLRRAVAGFETSSRLVTPVVVRQQHGARLGPDSAAALDQPRQLGTLPSVCDSEELALPARRGNRSSSGERPPHHGGRWFRNAVYLEQAKAVRDRLICHPPRRDAHRIKVVEGPRRRIG
jgi:O-antigen/teichoic acid export membrane protein